MADLTSVQITVYGRVQGVFFRAFTARQARELGLTGYVCNLPGGEAVEVTAEGLIGYLEFGPPGAKVEKVVASWSEYTGSYSNFGIRY